tara:strand:- start:48742 stop:49521 length:780 start_codon:yes stop_codon:yes gene_type:complete
MDFLHPLSGFLVGLMVGLTGVGGGSLMAPIMILLLGVTPATAVGTDLWFAAITKMVGGTVHHGQGHADWQIVRRLAWGSLPAALLTLWFLSTTQTHVVKSGLIMSLLGAVLILTAIFTLTQGRLYSMAATVESHHLVKFRKMLPPLTVLAGAILGVLVTLTSVGAGALGATMLVMLYPFRMTPQRIVGTDIVHAVPLTMVAGLGYLFMGKVDFALLLPLLVGSIPGIIIGAKLTSRINATALRWGLAGVLVVSGVRLLA